jgi:hypothetical protein
VTAPTDPALDGQTIPPEQVDGYAAQLLAAYVVASLATRNWVRDYVAQAWASLGRWDDAAAADFIGLVAPMLDAGRERMAELTATHLAQQTTLAVEHRLTFDTPTLELPSGSPRGVSDEELLRRPFVATWTDLSRGKPLDVAVATGARRADSLAVTDLQLAKTTTARRALSADGRVVGYRRVLTGNESCARCVLASTQRYHVGDLMPIHPGCDCGVAPIVGDHDPGQVIDERTAEEVQQIVADDLGQKYVDAGGRGPIDYRKIIVTHDHGEIGPILAVRGQHFDRLPAPVS